MTMAEQLSLEDFVRAGRAAVNAARKIIAPTEMDKRDEALDSLEAARDELIAVAKSIAYQLAREHGTVTSPQVIAEMKRLGWGDRLAEVDLRFMGVVFRRGWQRKGWATGKEGGSHARPVAIWGFPDG